MTLSQEVKTKINRLINQWPRGTVSVASYLNTLGFGYDLLVRYKKSGWIQSFGRGAYILYGDKVEWPGALYALQTQLGLNVHPGGKTALELKGYAHYLPSGKRKVFLYGTQGQVLPNWLKGERLGVDIVMTRTNLSPSNGKGGLSEFKEKGFSIEISSPERAVMEMLHLVPGKISFEEALVIMENLISLRPDMVQRLLVMCRSIKVKRLFMYMAEKQGAFLGIGPQPKDMRDIFEKEFKGMIAQDVTCEDLHATRDDLVSMLRGELTTEERRFIFSVKEGHPRWDLLALEGVENLPAVKWKLLNIGKINPSKHQKAVRKLRDYLGA